MKNNNVLFILGIIGIIAYLCFVASALQSLGILNMEVKKIVYKHYGVPLPKE